MGQGLVFPLAGKLGTAISVVGNFEGLFSLSLSLLPEDRVGGICASVRLALVRKESGGLVYT